MTNCPHRRRSAPNAERNTSQNVQRSVSEPSVRRWPHPIITDAEATSETLTDPSFQYIRCTLSYQNQLLADIKSLLEQIVEELTPVGESVSAPAQNASAKAEPRPE